MSDKTRPATITPAQHAQVPRAPGAGQRSQGPRSVPPVATVAPQGGALRLRIERLSLPGYSHAQSQRFVSALHRAISELAATGKLVSGIDGAQLAHLDAGQLAAGATPEQAARQLAERLCSGIAGHAAGSGRKHHG